jgi:hypothetical protein
MRIKWLFPAIFFMVMGTDSGTIRAASPERAPAYTWAKNTAVPVPVPSSAEEVPEPLPPAPYAPSCTTPAGQRSQPSCTTPARECWVPCKPKKPCPPPVNVKVRMPPCPPQPPMNEVLQPAPQDTTSGGCHHGVEMGSINIPLPSFNFPRLFTRRVNQQMTVSVASAATVPAAAQSFGVAATPVAMVPAVPQQNFGAAPPQQNFGAAPPSEADLQALLCEIRVAKARQEGQRQFGATQQGQKQFGAAGGADVQVKQLEDKIQGLEKSLDAILNKLEKRGRPDGSYRLPDAPEPLSYDQSEPQPFEYAGNEPQLYGDIQQTNFERAIPGQQPVAAPPAATDRMLQLEQQVLEMQRLMSEMAALQRASLMVQQQQLERARTSRRLPVCD